MDYLSYPTSAHFDGLRVKYATPEPVPEHYLDPQMQQAYVDENSGSSYLALPAVSHQTAQSKPPNGMASFPIMSQPSPPYTQSLSTCSGPLSPVPDVDYYPSTPPDSQTHGQFAPLQEAWSSNHHALRFTGMAPACVKPVDIDIYSIPEQHLVSCEDESPSPDLQPQPYMTGYDSFSNTPYHWGAQPSPVSQSPFEDETSSLGVAEEIHVHSPYPEPQAPGPNPATIKTKSAGQKKTPSPTRGTKRKHNEPKAARPQEKRSKTHKSSKGGFGCSECPDVAFQDEASLQKHTKSQHTRPFFCVFAFAGCHMTFPSKNEWKRHTASQHLLLHYWLCQQDQCGQESNGSQQLSGRCRLSSASREDEPVAPGTLPWGAIFNRKDLYTQHVRRMHVPTPIKKQTKQRKGQSANSAAATSPEWDERIRVMQDEAKQTRCDLPTHMECPAPLCGSHFEGPNAWDERMEHVAKHLEAAGQGNEPPIAFGGDNDRTLVNWASRPDVSIIVRSKANGAWQLCTPLKQAGGPRVAQREPMVIQVEEDQDAEGEDEY